MNYSKKMRTQLLLICSFLMLVTAVQAQYCWPRTATATCGQTITQVQVSDYIVNPSFDCPGNQGYFYFPNDTLFALLDAVNDVTVKEIGGLISNVQVFVDYNNDFLFSPDESTSLARQPNTNTHIGSIIPSGVTLGNYRIRVMLLTDYSSDGCGPTTGTMYQTVDYNLVVTDDPPVAPPTGAPTHCTASGPANCDDNAGGTSYPISKVQLTGDNGTEINNSSGCNGYSDFTAQKATVTGGDVYTATVAAGANALSQCAIYVDWNNDGDFDDADEAFMSPGNAQPHTIAIATPADAKTGVKRMRVRTTALVNTPLACGAQALGEVEDYSLVYINSINPSPACVTTTSPIDKYQGVCTNTTLSWNSVQDATTYELYLEDRATGTVAAQLSVVDTTYDVANLSAMTEYHWIVIPNADGSKAFGCDTLTFYTYANADPSFAITPSKDTLETCLNTDVSYDATATGGTGVITYAWNADNNLFFNDTTISNPVFNADTAGLFTISVDVRDVNQCGQLQTVALRVKEGFDITVYMNAEITDSIDACIGNDVSFDTNIDGGNGNETYSWSTTANGTFGQPNGVGTIFTPLEIANMKVILIVENDEGCKVEKLLTVNVVAAPDQPNIQAFNNPFCEGDSAVLVVTNYNNNITWSPGNVANDSLTVFASGEYVATYTNDQLCRSESEPQQVNEIEKPAAPVLLQANDSVCPGLEAILVATTVNNDAIVWSEGTQNDTLLTVIEGTYTAYAANTSGCISEESSITFTADAGPKMPQISVMGDDCEGGEKMLSSNQVENNKWSTTETSQNITVSTNGTYFLNTVWPNGCTSDTAFVTVDFSSTPTKPVVTQVDNSITTDSVVGNTYVWTDGSGNILYQGGNATFTPSESGDYFVMVIAANGCESELSNAFNFIHTGIVNYTLADLQVFPNPTNGVIHIRLPEGINGGQFRLMDITGKVIVSEQMVSNESQITIQKTTGVYAFIVILNDQLIQGTLQVN